MNLISERHKDIKLISEKYKMSKIFQVGCSTS